MKIRVRLPGPGPLEARSALRRVERCFWLAGFLALGYCGIVFLEASAYQAYRSWELNRALEEKPYSSSPVEEIPASRQKDRRPASLPAPRQKTGLIGRLEASRIGLRAMVLEGADAGTLQLGVGHLPGTALPGEAGNVVLAGHRDTFFRPLRNIREGDELTVTAVGGTHRYVVESIAVTDPHDARATQASGRAALTLITCYPFSYVGRAPKRLVVQARELTGQLPPQDLSSPLPPRNLVARAPRAPVGTPSSHKEERGGSGPAMAAATNGEASPAASGVRTASDSSATRTNHGIRRIKPGRFFGKLARIIRPAKQPGPHGEEEARTQAEKGNAAPATTYE